LFQWELYYKKGSGYLLDLERLYLEQIQMRNPFHVANYYYCSLSKRVEVTHLETAIHACTIKFLLQYLGINASLGTYIIKLHDTGLPRDICLHFGKGHYGIRMDDRHSIHILHSIKAFGVLTIWSKLRHINISTISNLIQFKCVGPPN
jgi:hypothetical protein